MLTVWSTNSYSHLKSMKVKKCLCFKEQRFYLEFLMALHNTIIQKVEKNTSLTHSVIAKFIFSLEKSNFFTASNSNH